MQLNTVTLYGALATVGLLALVGAAVLIWRGQRRRQRDAEARQAAALAALHEAQRHGRELASQRAAAKEAALKAAERALRQDTERAERLAAAALAHAEALQAAEREAAAMAARREAEQAAAALRARQTDDRLAEEAAARKAAAAMPGVDLPAPVAARLDAGLVMVADDSKVVRVKTGRLLSRHGYRVALAEDGAEAARMIEAEVPMVLVTDVEMPVMDGLQLARHVRGQAHTRDLPIIMITSADERMKDAAAEVGVTVVLGKPYAEDALLACIEAAQARRAQADTA